jgi:putative membrane protein
MADPLDEGAEPDYRFTLANERTFLAWIRTALGLLALGIGVRQLVPEFAVTGARTGVAVALVTVAAAVAGLAYPRWRQVQVAMRHDRPLPRTRVIPLVAALVVVVAVFAAVLVITG